MIGANRSFDYILPRSLHDELVQAEGLWSAALLGLLAFLLPLAPAVLPALTAAIVVVQLVTQVQWRSRSLLRLDLGNPALGAALFLILHVVGMAWTSNTDFGWFDVGIKLPLLLFPLFALLPGTPRGGRDAVLAAFCLGNALAVLLCVAVATGRVAFSGEGIGAFLSSRSSLFLHPSYFALYLTTGLAVWFLGGLHLHFRPVIAWTVVALMAVGTVLTESRMGWIVLPLVLLWSLVHLWSEDRVRKPLIGVIAACAVGAVLLVSFSAGVRERMVEMVTASGADVAPDVTTSASVRVLTWRAAREVFSEHAPWGTGTGDVKDELISNYERSGYSFAAEHRLNAHDQYLQTAAALGIPGVLSLVLMLLVPLLLLFLCGDRSTRAVRMCVLLIFSVNWVVESMLETQAGALFTGFMLWVLWWPAPSTPSSRS